jgi:hypothetical protein
VYTFLFDLEYLHLTFEHFQGTRKTVQNVDEVLWQEALKFHGIMKTVTKSLLKQLLNNLSALFL